MIKIFFATILLCFASSAVAQKTRAERKAARKEQVSALIKQNEEGLTVFNKHLTYGAYLSTEGTHLFIEKGLRSSRRKTTLYKIELAEKKHQREERSASGGIFGAGNSIIYAKLNNVYQLGLTYGMQYLLGSRGNKNGIEVSAVGTAGLQLNFQKPYFYDVENLTTLTRSRVNFDIDTGKYQIFGASGFSYGWKQVKINPGVFARTGLRFEYGRDWEKVNAIEVGLQTEFFASKVPQVFALKQRNLFVGAYLGIVFGKRK